MWVLFGEGGFLGVVCGFVREEKGEGKGVRTWWVQAHDGRVD